MAEPYDDNLEMLKSKFIAPVNVNYPRDVFHNFAENMISTTHVLVIKENINDLLKESKLTPFKIQLRAISSYHFVMQLSARKFLVME